MIGIYFSGTGNTKFCITRFVRYFNEMMETKNNDIEIEKNIEKIENIDGVKKEKMPINIYAIDDKKSVKKLKIASLANNDYIALAYPIYYSDMPRIMKDFIINNPSIFKGKKIFIITTMGLFSGDGSGIAKRMLKESMICGSLQIKMPDNVADVKLLKKSKEENLKRIKQADRALKIAAGKLVRNRARRDGLSFLDMLKGLFGQRLWFSNMTEKLKLSINDDRCIKCRKCIDLCPVDNLFFDEGQMKVMTNDRCTLCYRCINYCDSKAITMIGKEIVVQNRIENYVDEI